MAGAELTLIETDALPFEQFASLTIALSTIGPLTVTVREADGELMPLCVTPSDQRIDHGPVPVSVNGTVTDDVPHATSIDAGSVMVGRAAIAASAVLLALQPAPDVTVTARCTPPNEPAV